MVATHQSDAGVDEANAGDDGEETDELVRVLLELEVDGGREHDGPDELPLDRAEPGPHDDGKDSVASIVSGLK